MPVLYQGGGSGSSSGVNIPEYYVDPASPTPEETWVLASLTGTGHAAGSPIGLLLSLTYSSTVYMYQLSYRTLEGTTVRTTLA